MSNTYWTFINVSSSGRWLKNQDNDIILLLKLISYTFWNLFVPNEIFAFWYLSSFSNEELQIILDMIIIRRRTEFSLFSFEFLRSTEFFSFRFKLWVRMTQKATCRHSIMFHVLTIISFNIFIYTSLTISLFLIMNLIHYTILLPIGNN